MNGWAALGLGFMRVLHEVANTMLLDDETHDAIHAELAELEAEDNAQNV